MTGKKIGKVALTRRVAVTVHLDEGVADVLRMITRRLVISRDDAVARGVVMLFASLPPYY